MMLLALVKQLKQLKTEKGQIALESVLFFFDMKMYNNN